jgi:hypothetical protein
VVHFIGFAAPLKYLLVVLKPGVATGAHLAALTPDTAAMRGAVPGEELTGVIVAAAGGSSSDGDQGEVAVCALFSSLFRGHAGMQPGRLVGPRSLPQHIAAKP